MISGAEPRFQKPLKNLKMLNNHRTEKNGIKLTTNYIYIYLSKRGKWALKIKRNRMASMYRKNFYLAGVVIIVVIVVKVVGKSKINQNR